MKLAIDSFSYHLHFGKHWFVPAQPRDLRWYAEACRQLGVAGLHIDPLHIDLSIEVDWLAEYARRHRLFVELGAIGTSPEALAAPLAAAERVGAKVLRTFIGGSCAKGKAATAARAAQARKELARSVVLAEQHGVVVALENHMDIFLEDLLEILKIDSPFLGICYDSGNFAAVGEDPLQALAALRERVACTHLKDTCPAGRFADAPAYGLPGAEVHFCALGEGTLPLRQIVQMLRQVKGEDMPLTLEICTPFRHTLPESDLLAWEAKNVARSVRYAREVLGIS